MVKLSICIPTYNRPDYLKRAVSSVLTSTTGAFEILIFDNSDNAESEAIACLFEDSRIIYKRHSENLGMMGNWNALIESAKGQYIKFLNDDDWFEPGAVDFFLKHIDMYRNVALFNYRARYMNGTDGLVKVDPSIRGESVNLPGKEAAQSILSGSRRLGAPSQIMFRRDYALRAGGFGRVMSYSLDIRLWARLLGYGNAVFINNEPPINILLHPKQAANSFPVEQKIIDQQEINKILFETSGLDSDVKKLSALNSFIAWHEMALALRSGDLLSAIKALSLTGYQIRGLKEFVRRDIVRKV